MRFPQFCTQNSDMFYHLSIHHGLSMIFPSCCFDGTSLPVRQVVFRRAQRQWFHVGQEQRRQNHTLDGTLANFIFGHTKYTRLILPNTKIALHIFRYQESHVVITWHSIDFRIFTEYLQWLPTFASHINVRPSQPDRNLDCWVGATWQFSRRDGGVWPT